MQHLADDRRPPAATEAFQAVFRDCWVYVENNYPRSDLKLDYYACREDK